MSIENIGINITKEVLVAIVAWMKKPIVTVVALNKNNIPIKGVTITLNDRCEKTVGSGKAIFEGLATGKHILSVKYGEKEETELEVIFLEAGEKATITLILPDSLFEIVPQPHPWQEDKAKGAVGGIAVIKLDPFEIFIAELATFVHINSSGELDMTEAQKVKDTILSSSQNLGAAFLVVQSLDGIKQQLLRKLRADIEKQLETRSYHLIWDKELATGKNYAKIGILFDSRQDKHLYFRFGRVGLNEFYLAITRKDENIVISETARNEISAIMENIFKTAHATVHSPWWSPSNEIGLEEYRDWSKNPLPWQAIQDGTLADKIVGIADKVHAAFKDRMDLLMPTQS